MDSAPEETHSPVDQKELDAARQKTGSKILAQNGKRNIQLLTPASSPAKYALSGRMKQTAKSRKPAAAPKTSSTPMRKSRVAKATVARKKTAPEVSASSMKKPTAKQPSAMTHEIIDLTEDGPVAPEKQDAEAAVSQLTPLQKDSADMQAPSTTEKQDAQVAVSYSTPHKASPDVQASPSPTDDAEMPVPMS